MSRFRPWPVTLSVIVMGLWMFLAMMLVHELGHVLAAYATGGTITSVELRPARLSHTLVQPNPQPSIVLWSGFVFGWLAPQGLAAAWPRRDQLSGFAIKAWADFCLLAGGSYLAIGGGERLTDTGQLAAEGWPNWLLVAVGVSAAVVGYARSRTVWPSITKLLECDPHASRLLAAIVLGFAVWWAGQSMVHYALQPAA